MPRRRRFDPSASAPGEADARARHRRRAVLDDARRKVERALAVEGAAEELARAAQAVLMDADTEMAARSPRGLEGLRAALTRYRAARGG